MITLTTSFLCGCQDYQLRIAACEDCIEEKPDRGPLNLLFTINGTHQEVPFQVFEGTFEEGKLIRTDTALTNRVELILETGKEYTIAATYAREGTSVKVINAVKIKTRKAGCTEEGYDEVTHYCWYTLPESLDLILKTATP